MVVVIIYNIDFKSQAISLKEEVKELDDNVVDASERFKKKDDNDGNK